MLSIYILYINIFYVGLCARTSRTLYACMKEPFYNSQVLKIYWSPNRCWRSGKFRLEWDSLSLSLVLVECRVLRAVIIIRNAKQRLNARVYFVEASILTSERFDANTKFVYCICLLFIVCSRMQKAICDPQSFAKSCAWMLLSILMLYIYSAKNVTYNFNYCERFSQLCWLRCPCFVCMPTGIE